VHRPRRHDSWSQTNRHENLRVNLAMVTSSQWVPSQKLFIHGYNLYRKHLAEGIHANVTGYIHMHHQFAEFFSKLRRYRSSHNNVTLGSLIPAGAVPQQNHGAAVAPGEFQANISDRSNNFFYTFISKPFELDLCNLDPTCIADRGGCQ
jgi:hypothetical protein